MRRFLLCAVTVCLLPLMSARAAVEDPPDDARSTSASDATGPTQEIVDSSKVVPWTRWGSDYEAAKQAAKEIDVEIQKAEDGS